MGRWCYKVYHLDGERMKRMGQLVDIVLDAILLLVAAINVISGNADWNDYLILSGLIVIVLVRIIRRFRNRINT